MEPFKSVFDEGANLPGQHWPLFFFFSFRAIVNEKLVLVNSRQHLRYFKHLELQAIEETSFFFTFSKTVLI